IFFYDVGGGGIEGPAYGYDDQTPGERIARMDEGLALIRRLWTSSEPVSFEGTYYHVHQAICRPRPVQQPTPPIWLGEIREDPWCEVICRHASGWNSTPVTVAEYQARLDQLTTVAGRV